MEEKTAIYPGTFDPITRGHIDIIQRAAKIFHRLIVAVAHNPGKHPLFSVEERTEMIHESLAPLDLPNVEVETFSSLLISYAKSKGATAIVRGLRAVSDFEYEFQMALMNRKLNREIQSVFLMTDYKWFYTSSTIIKEAARFGGDVSGLVPDVVNRKLKEKFSQIKNT